MDVCLYGRCHSSYTRPTDGREYRVQLNYSPSLLRRSRTSYNRQAFSPSPRIQSANPRVAMATPRTQVSMAGFFDWSTEELDDFGTSSVYQKIAISNKHKYNKGNKSWCADGIHMNPGRMFVRDKAELTKGEREIIAGICKNRSDSNKYGHVTNIKSHKDAWLVGKNVQTRNGNSPRLDCERCSMKIPEYLFSRLYTPNKASPSSGDGYLCDSCKEESIYRVSSSEKADDKRYAVGRKAPPSSPTDSPRIVRKHPPKLTKAKAAEGAILIESSKTFYDPYEGSKKKKVFVDVFLPKFPSPMPVPDEQSCVSADEDEQTSTADGPHRLKGKVCSSQDNNKLFTSQQTALQTSS